MTDYVLIHGAWHGSWCWTRVRRLLTARAHRVFTPTLTGLAERSHLLSRDVGLNTHVDDVANLMIWQDLRDIVLVGHRSLVQPLGVSMVVLVLAHIYSTAVDGMPGMTTRFYLGAEAVLGTVFLTWPPGTRL